MRRISRRNTRGIVRPVRVGANAWRMFVRE